MALTPKPALLWHGCQRINNALCYVVFSDDMVATWDELEVNCNGVLVSRFRILVLVLCLISEHGYYYKHKRVNEIILSDLHM
jgi:hypothetical protein